MANVWNPSSAVSVNSNTTLRPQIFTATEGQTLFTLTQFTYAVSTNSLLIFKNGENLISGVDFAETAEDKFTFTVACHAGDKIIAYGFVGITAVVSPNPIGSGVYLAGATGGTANAQTASINGYSVYTTGDNIYAIPSVSNTGAMTLKINNLGAINVLDASGAPVTTGTIKVGTLCEFIFDGASFRYTGDGVYAKALSGVAISASTLSGNTITGGTVSSLNSPVAIADGGTGAGTAGNARINLGVTATGLDTTYAYRVNNLSDLANVTTARTNLGLGSIATQNASSVAITGGTANLSSLSLSGSAISATAAEINKLSGVTATTVEINRVAGVTPGTAAASSVVVLDANKNISSLGNVGVGGSLSAWGGTTNGAVELPVGSVSSHSNGWSVLNNNLYLDSGGNWKYKANGNAAQVSLSPTGDVVLYSAVSGTAGTAATLTQIGKWSQNSIPASGYSVTGSKFIAFNGALPTSFTYNTNTTISAPSGATHLLLRISTAAVSANSAPVTRLATVNIYTDNTFVGYYDSITAQSVEQVAGLGSGVALSVNVAYLLAPVSAGAAYAKFSNRDAGNQSTASWTIVGYYV